MTDLKWNLLTSLLDRAQVTGFAMESHHGFGDLPSKCFTLAELNSPKMNILFCSSGEYRYEPGSGTLSLPLNQYQTKI
jgi:hypothetical protein